MNDDRPTPPPSEPAPGSTPPPGVPVISPPPPPPRPQAEAQRSSGPVAWVLALTLLLIPVGIAYLRKSSGDDSYAIGYAFGTAIGIVFLAAVGSAIYRRFAGSGRDLAMPFALGLAALVAIGGQFVLRGLEHHTTEAEFVAHAEDCAAGGSDPFANLPANIQMADLPPAQRAQLETAFASQTTDGLSPDRILGHVFMTGGRPVGYGVAIPGLTDDDLADFRAGVSDSVAAQGGQTESATVAGTEVLVAEINGTTAIAGKSGCYAILVGAQDRASSESLAAPMLGG